MERERRLVLRRADGAAGNVRNELLLQLGARGVWGGCLPPPWWLSVPGAAFFDSIFKQVQETASEQGRSHYVCFRNIYLACSRAPSVGNERERERRERTLLASDFLVSYEVEKL